MKSHCDIWELRNQWVAQSSGLLIVDPALTIYCMPWPAMRENQEKLGTPKGLFLVLCAADAALPLVPVLLTLLNLEWLIITCSKVCTYVCFFSFLQIPTHISFGMMAKEWKKGKALHILKQFSLHERENEREQDTYITQMRGLSLLGPGVVCPGSLFLAPC